MNKKIIPLIFCGLFTCVFSTIAWEMKKAPLMTFWGESIDPNNVLPEYPRPQMERSEWMNLNGIWGVAIGKSGDTYDVKRNFNQEILVPFPVESALSGIMDGDYRNADKNYWYKKTFTLNDSYTNKDVLLHFGAVDWECKVFINGQEIGLHKGGYDAFSFNITDYLKPVGEEQELVVRVYDSQWAGGHPHGKQSLNPNGIWYSPVTGIWQTVWIEPVSNTHINDFHIIPDIDKGTISVNVKGANTTNKTEAVVCILDEGKTLSETKIDLDSYTDITIEHPKLWSPNSPFLYDIKIVLREDGKVLDEVKSYFGMRKIHLGKNGDIPWIYLNNEPIFQFGVLDQGWWPDGLYTAPSDEAMLFDLQLIKKMGLNTVRKHVKTEPARWYYHCDRLGLMVWQDIPNATTNTNRNDWVEDNFIREMENIINSYKNAPCITTWVIFNEGWGQYDRDDQIRQREPYTREAVAKAIQLNERDKRIINAASGWFDYEIGDMIDKHHYPGPTQWPNPSNQRASVCGEYGGVNLKVENHIWAGSEVHYQTVSDSEALTKEFIKYAEVVENLRANGLCGAIYTQTSDVESEINGLITYDRKVIKLDDKQIEQVKTAIGKCYAPLKSYNTVIPASRTKAYAWKYSTKGASRWYKEDFDDTEWKTGNAGFGSAGKRPIGIARTPWEDDTKIYLRRSVYIGDLTDALETLALEVLHDGDYKIYINGTLAASGTGSSYYYMPVKINAEAKNTLKQNAYNLIAVECLKQEGERFIDLGIITEGEYEYVENTETNYTTTSASPFVFPNPAKEFFFVKEKVENIAIMSLDGNILFSFESQEKHPVSSLQEGIYILKIIDKKGHSHTEKLIIKN